MSDAVVNMHKKRAVFSAHEQPFYCAIVTKFKNFQDSYCNLHISHFLLQAAPALVYS